MATLITIACANNGNPKVNIPEKIETTTTVQGETTVHVIHEIAVSLEMQAAFQDDCKNELGPDATEIELEACKNNKIQQYIEDFMSLLNQLNQTQQGGTNANP